MIFSGIAFLIAGLIILSALTVLVIKYEREKRAFIRKFFSPELRVRLFSNYAPNIIELKYMLFLAGLLFVFIALAGPQFGTKYMNIKKAGVDVLIAIDSSKSMLAEDLKPNRLEKAKSEMLTLIERLKGNRIGIVAFSGKAFLQCPLTLDIGSVKTIMSLISTDLIPVPGTAIAEAINISAQAFNRSERKYKALILLTDGEDHEGNVESAVNGAKKEGVRIYTVGFGTPVGELIPSKDAAGGVAGYEKDKSGGVISTKLNEEMLQKTALDTGGKYFRATDGEVETALIAEEINNFDKKQLSSKKFERYEEKFYYFAMLAFVLLIIEILL